ncbi:MAG: ABC-2 family transporter protein, partial [Clostridia bacterium]
WATLSILFAIYIGLLLFYLVGISSFWTTEINGAHYILITLIFGLGGQLLPVDLLPGWLSQLAMLLPFSCLLYVPSMLYLEQQSPEWLFLPLSWAIILTIIALVVTQLARRRTEIQGG